VDRGEHPEREDQHEGEDEHDPRLAGARTESGWIQPFALWGRHLRYPVLTLLADAGNPLTLSEILDRLRALDLDVRGPEPRRVLSDALRYECRLDRVRRVSRGTYAIGPPRPVSTERRHRLRLATARRVAADLRRRGLGPPPAAGGDTLLCGPAEAPDRSDGGPDMGDVGDAQDDRYDWGPLVEDLRARRATALQMGGAERVERQRSLGKWPVRERLDALVDAGTFVEYGMLADHMDPHLAAKGSFAADGCVTGIGQIDGRRVAICAYDFTVQAGSMGQVNEFKVARMRELALRQRIPVIWLLDSAGARITSGAGSTFAGAGALFREQVTLSGVVPQVAAMVGHCSAGTAYIPALADFVPMVKGTSSMALAGRHLVKAATGEDVTEEEMGGSEVHTKVSGVADMEVPDDAECLHTVRRYLSYFPSNNTTAPPVADCDDPVDRRCEELYHIVPTAPRRAYDMHKVIASVVDHDADGASDFFEMKAAWARNIITGFGRVGGHPIGIVGSNPMVLGGALDVNSADKAARFVWLCDAFGIPLVFLHDVPGFVVGSAVEKQGIIRHGAKMLFAVCEATVPKISIVVRKSYGAGYFVMNGLSYEADYLAVWPAAEIAVMGPDGMVNITMRKHLADFEGKELDAERIRLAEEFRKNIDPYVAAGHAMVDDVIDPAETRLAIWRGLQVSRTKQVDRPWRKHGVLPV
jgi:acetyl-CoA carboxylase carboxyltransferase component